MSPWKKDFEMMTMTDFAMMHEISYLKKLALYFRPQTLALVYKALKSSSEDIAIDE